MRNRKFYKVLAVLLAAVLVLPVAGCGKKKNKEEAAVPAAETEEEELTGGESASYAGGAPWGTNCEGSAISLDGTTAIVSVFVHNESDPFNKKEMSSVKKKVKTALEFIEKEAKSRKVKTEFVFDKSDLEVDFPFYGESIEDFEAEDYDGYIDEINEASINQDEIRKKYKADGILYLFIIEGEGDAFASPHWIEDGEDYFNEGAYVFTQAYNEDYDAVPVGPDVIVHQILQTFGAIELEYPDATYGYTTKLCDAARNKYKDDVMLSVYDDKGNINEQKCIKKITDITAYSLGLVKTFDELKDNEVFKRMYRLSFEDCYIKNMGENDEHSADYDWVDEWDDLDSITFDDEEGIEDDLDADDETWLDMDEADWDEIEEEAEDEERTE